jgi:hypothetical protein
MSKLKNKKVKQDEVPTSAETEVVSEEQKANTTPTFVVIRGGCRVSDREYKSPEDPFAVDEKDFWQKVVNRYPDGTKVEIVPFDKKKHRIW